MMAWEMMIRWELGEELGIKARRAYGLVTDSK